MRRNRRHRSSARCYDFSASAPSRIECRLRSSSSSMVSRCRSGLSGRNSSSSCSARSNVDESNCLPANIRLQLRDTSFSVNNAKLLSRVKGPHTCVVRLRVFYLPRSNAAKRPTDSPRGPASTPAVGGTTRLQFTAQTAAIRPECCRSCQSRQVFGAACRRGAWRGNRPQRCTAGRQGRDSVGPSTQPVRSTSFTSTGRRL